MSDAPVELLLEDIMIACDKIFRYSKGFERREILSNSEKFEAIVYNLQIIGEASNKLPMSFTEKHSYLPWRNIIDMRHRLVHDYNGINTEIVMNIVQFKLIELYEAIKKIQP